MPESSGAALKPSVQSYGARLPGRAHGFPGIEHSEAYSTGANTFFFVFEEIHRLCQSKIRQAWSPP